MSFSPKLAQARAALSFAGLALGGQAQVCPDPLEGPWAWGRQELVGSDLPPASKLGTRPSGMIQGACCVSQPSNIGACKFLDWGRSKSAGGARPSLLQGETPYKTDKHIYV